MKFDESQHRLGGGNYSKTYVDIHSASSSVPEWRRGAQTDSSKPSENSTISGIPLEALVAELAPQKKYNTADFEYVQQLESERRKHALLRKLEVDKELREIKKAQNEKANASRVGQLARKETPPKPIISKGVSALIRVKPKPKPDQL